MAAPIASSSPMTRSSWTTFLDALPQGPRASQCAQARQPPRANAVGMPRGAPLRMACHHATARE
eukprot:7299979-Pyramimonas_sp.AAC.1